MARPILCKQCGNKFFIGPSKKTEWEKDYMRCKKCGSLYCSLTKTEKKLRELQDIYMINKSDYIFGLMYNILFDYVRSIIKRHFIHKIYSVEYLDYYAHNAITIFTKEYLNSNKEFKIETSFSGFLFLKIKEAIWRKEEKPSGQIEKKINKNDNWSPQDIFKNKNKGIDWIKENDYKKEIIDNISLNYKLSDGHELNCEDTKYSVECIEKEENKQYIKKTILNILINLKDKCEDSRENCIRLLNIILHLKYGEKKSDYYWKTFNEPKHSKYGKWIYQQSMTILYEYLKDVYNKKIE